MREREGEGEGGGGRERRREGQGGSGWRARDENRNTIFSSCSIKIEDISIPREPLGACQFRQTHFLVQATTS